MTERFLNNTFHMCIWFSLFCLIIYIPRMIGWLGALRPQVRLQSSRKNRFAVIIPAKNEGKIIDDIFVSLIHQTYPRELFDIHVIVKEENDITINKTKKIGGFCYVAKEQTCKGDALDFCMSKIIRENPDYYDAFYIVDADCLLSSDCLEEINHAMASGAQVIQSKKIVKNYLSKNKKANSMASACNGLIWTLIDDMGNRYKSDRGITNMTIGTGLLLRNDLVKRLGGWPYRKTLTEDMELMNDCAVHGYPTFYYSYSQIYVEEATSLRMTNIRRTRWLTGLIDSKMLYNDELNAAAKDIKKLKNIYFVKALWPVFYYIGGLAIFAVFHLLTSIYFMYIHSSLIVLSFLYFLFGIGVIYASFWIMTLFCIIVEWKNIGLPFIKKLALLFVHPIFYMGYIPIIAKAFLKKNTESWESIERVDFQNDDYRKDMSEDECYQVRYFKNH